MANETNLDLDPTETREWLDALQAVLINDGPERGAFLLKQLLNKANTEGLSLTTSINTPYRNTIKVHEEKQIPPDEGLGKRISALIRWNAVAMVLRAGKYAAELGGHIASYASSSTLYETGFNHFFKGANGEHCGDLIYIQGHSSPGIYARAFLEGRLTEEQLNKFRQEVEVDGLSSYPHPWLMSEFWQFPTVSMGLGPLQAIYQARFLKYLENRGLIKNDDRKVWAFLGDGEMDEPESVGALSIAAREKLDNLIFVVNCNLQRLDGPVRGNGKIIQELEGLFRGAGWNVIKVIWGGRWDPLFARDKEGWLQKRMEECVDGDYQAYKANNGAYVRQHFFNQYPELKKMVENYTDEEIWRLNRGGHDPQKVYAAYAKAVEHKGSPTIILAKTIKGYGMGAAGEGQNITHQQKKMTIDQLKAFRDRFSIPISDEHIADIPFYKPADDSPEIKYIKKQREMLGGYLPSRSTEVEPLKIPPLADFSSVTKGLGDREISTTMAFVRILSVLLKNKEISSRIVPIVPDECRTFGMEGLFRQIGIYSPVGQLYTPVDHEQVMFYREAKDGQILEEGINEAGAFCSWIAAATSYSSNKLAMIPFYIYYSMFGFQRVGDLAWAAGDMQARGFLLGGTAGRTTLAGEGLQHQDGHSHLYASTIPNCVSYDPTFAYELAVIIQNGLHRMYEKQENIFYYITVMNENYMHPDMPEGVEEGIIKGMYLLQENKKKSKHHVQLMGSGTILREVIEAAKMLKEDYSVTSDIWSVTSFNELRRDGLAAERYNTLHPQEKQLKSYVATQLEGSTGPVIAATDYMRIYAEQIRPFVPNHFVTLGTDGYGRSDTRERLRHFFEVDAKFIVLAALNALVAEGSLDKSKVVDAIKRYNINPDKVNPVNH
ncbi:pyruvate dehydrogenase (acetyl-transferring), homodimeric type [Fluoribacter dumoffii]|uniref:Pyruvate dehydrogenase E1 component n=1 Tax=Fluoribacter dumoffii TaxID=463 RepID=A0A377GB33_9GAMM|nr:pyruvate dehydrogenase (acetyl-transferring), homodimeric type [Fluoribacter dumoffii]KTC89058.1 Pyruvate dehydrogenase (decarboxylase component) E1p [Fluoribacter dumoffii NY 23]MCW8385734.1 pyruvate dehydrogenase (acetyl-transferring), homodimeric type [Fluoribacter dumoffii]MCW8418764.1 pyruvate dehydrogenase (acetyl-transferring), homodimeric type [Fluoribacter dumoffii]MCW8453392.1 pyruvate dehydrogenase (acetyl-transferring), homodimeric type [Fluoribacter dumoffii]MCW8459388.1 pyruva